MCKRLSKRKERPRGGKGAKRRRRTAPLESESFEESLVDDFSDVNAPNRSLLLVVAARSLLPATRQLAPLYSVFVMLPWSKNTPLSAFKYDAAEKDALWWMITTS